MSAFKVQVPEEEEPQAQNTWPRVWLMLESISWRTVYWLRKAGKEYPAGTVDEDNMVPTANGSASNGERQKWTQ